MSTLSRLAYLTILMQILEGCRLWSLDLNSGGSFANYNVVFLATIGWICLLGELVLVLRVQLVFSKRNLQMSVIQTVCENLTTEFSNVADEFVRYMKMTDKKAASYQKLQATTEEKEQKKENGNRRVRWSLQEEEEEDPAATNDEKNEKKDKDDKTIGLESCLQSDPISSADYGGSEEISFLPPPTTTTDNDRQKLERQLRWEKRNRERDERTPSADHANDMDMSRKEGLKNDDDDDEKERDEKHTPCLARLKLQNEVLRMKQKRHLRTLKNHENISRQIKLLSANLSIAKSRVDIQQELVIRLHFIFHLGLFAILLSVKRDVVALLSSYILFFVIVGYSLVIGVRFCSAKVRNTHK